MTSCQILTGDSRKLIAHMADRSVRCCVTSPPYWGLRDYKHKSQIGRETTPEQYVDEIVAVFREVKRVLTDDGTLWLNLGDSYMKNKQLAGIPWRVALALQADGWLLRQDIIWHKPNPMPEKVSDRCKKSHEYLFLLAKSANYYYDQTWDERSVWSIPTQPFNGAHFAVMPEALAERCVLTGSALGDIVFDPFTGSGTVPLVAIRNKRNFVGIELNPDYVEIANNRLNANYSSLEGDNGNRI